jgi:mitogen-activated protein kinase organizer 1
MFFFFHSSTDNSRFASGGGDKSAFLWDVSTGKVIRRFQGHFNV